MKFKTSKYFAILAFLVVGSLLSCVADKNSPGLEFMPDMYRSPSVEAYVDYAEVRGLFRPELLKNEVSFTPPTGTIPFYGTGDNVSYMMPYKHGAPIGFDKTHGLYGVKQDSIGSLGAKFDVNPIPYSEDILNEGKAIFEVFCIHCHGETGNGQGTVVTNSLGKFPTPGAYSTELSAGEIFYTITYGKGAMGSHASFLNKEERWKVVWYVQKLQGKEFEEGDVITDTIPLVIDAHSQPIPIDNDGEE